MPDMLFYQTSICVLSLFIQVLSKFSAVLLKNTSIKLDK